MTRRVEYSDLARVDLAKIWDHLADRVSIRGADSAVQSIEETLRRTLLRYPSTGRARPELGSGIRSFPIVPYLVFYRVEQRRIYIERVLHGHRDIRQPLMSLLVA
ncbi:MAG: type II toxin-antitoxin system RelE/ParE family toxin [Candidatus Eremiobacteraeota bacterium]|nr:type II toxin-antitoxin system RelE/ParE family toxin [Candidatus Eremiobacteraeota bacterium]MBV8366308.1 type II toxin-antitoxin system RelE/ParE family toxin [Candidatus Eremiobacteraeota bacterium]